MSMKVVAVFIMAVLLVFLKSPSQAAEKKAEIRVIAADSVATKEAGVFCRRFSRLFSEYASAMKNVNELAKEWQISCLEYVDSSPDSRGVLCGLLEELGYKRIDTKQKPWQLPAFLTFDDGEYAFTPDGDGAIQFVAKHDFGRKDLVVPGMFLSFRQTPMSGTNILTGVKNFYSSESK